MNTIHVNQHSPLQRKPSINDKKINYWTISIIRAVVYGYEIIPDPLPCLRGFCLGYGYRFIKILNGQRNRNTRHAGLDPASRPFSWILAFARMTLVRVFNLRSNPDLKFRKWYGKEALLAKPVLVDVLLTDFRQ